MIPKRIAVKNFLTFGEQSGGKPVEFVFVESEPLWVLCGANGTGKSAVFDAITYSLYGEHRGGKQKAEQLIRHNANGFEVEFDFEFNKVDYRIRRTRQRRCRTTQHLQMRVNGDWKCVRGNDNNGAVDAKDINDWVIETLGLGYDAFTNSVLLQQGKADKLFSASRDDRIEVLKGIIGFEHFQALSDRINASTREKSQRVEILTAQRDAILEVPNEQLAQAEEQVGTALAGATAAQRTLAKANERITKAREWENLEKEFQGLTEKINAADERQKQGQKIREDKAKLDDLISTVPVLEKLFELRDQLGILETNCQNAKCIFDTKTAERDAAKQAADMANEKMEKHKTEGEKHDSRVKELAGEIEMSKKYLGEADAIADLNGKLEGFPVNLDSLLDGVSTEEGQADDALQTANSTQTRIQTLLTQAEEQQKEFAVVKTGVECPHCRQRVDETHAKKVRADLADEVLRLKSERDNANTTATEANANLTLIRVSRTDLQQKKCERDNLLTKRDTKQDSLKSFGVMNNAVELRDQLAEKEKQKNDSVREQSEAERLYKDAKKDVAVEENKRTKLELEVKSAEDTVKRHETALATTRGQNLTTIAHLTDEWKIRLPDFDRAMVIELAADRDRMIEEKVSEKFRELEQDVTRRDVWENQRSIVERDIAGIDQSDRISELSAKEQQAQADKAEKEKNKAHTDAVNLHKELSNRKKQREDLTEEHRSASEDHRLFTKLDKLLGDTGLQLELVRDAEEQIISFANETLQHLTDGDLSLEEDTSSDSSTKTFDLRVRCGGGEPIGVAFLSGSQKFRVAVSIALAVGRFATGRARPLEAVIIDEGFGSLDPMGLQAMAKELKDLQQAKSLKRVILVSHQPDFSEQFSVGYTLASGENGTTATAFRR
jgi:DNA repair exonuclease SbcCD ATPase subunit